MAFPNSLAEGVSGVSTLLGFCFAPCPPYLFTICRINVPELGIELIHLASMCYLSTYRMITDLVLMVPVQVKCGFN